MVSSDLYTTLAGGLFFCTIRVTHMDYNTHISVRIHEDYGSWNEWEQYPTSFSEGLTYLLELFRDQPEYLNMDRGLFLIKEDSPAFSGQEDDGTWMSMISDIRPALRRPE